MQIITLTCPDCGTIVAGNVLEARRVMKCPGRDCESVLEFSDLDQSEQDHIVSNIERYRLE